MPKLLALSLIFLAVSSNANATESHFLELQGHGVTATYDLRTVKIISPGRFTIDRTTVSSPDLMRRRVEAGAIMFEHCQSPVGSYPPPQHLKSDAKSGMVAEDILVRGTSPDKHVTWKYSHRLQGRGNEMAPQFEVLYCNDFLNEKRHRNSVMRGRLNKLMFDCKRAVIGTFPDDEENPPLASVDMDFAGDRGGWQELYVDLCTRVLKSKPYLP